MKKSNVVTTILLAFITLFLASCTEKQKQSPASRSDHEMAMVQAAESAAREPVQIFTTYYGTAEMEKVADVTTEYFRAGKSKKEWVSFTGRLLWALGYERVQSEIKRTVVDGQEGYVHVRAVIGTVAGRTEHDEIFRVINDAGVWKVDSLRIVNEQIEEKLREL